MQSEPEKTKKSTRGATKGKQKETKEMKQRNSKKKPSELKKSESSASSKSTSKANSKDNQLSDERKATVPQTSFSKDETDEIFFSLIDECNSTTQLEPDSLANESNAVISSSTSNAISSEIRIASNSITNSISDSISDAISNSINNSQDEVECSNASNLVKASVDEEHQMESKQVDESEPNTENDHQMDVAKANDSKKDELSNGGSKDEIKSEPTSKKDGGSPVRDTINEIISIIENSSTSKEDNDLNKLPNDNCTTNSTNGSNSETNLEN